MAFPLPPWAEQERIVAEAEARLTASRAQRSAVQRSLARFDTMRQEVLAAAVGGSLVDQNPTDEHAAALLARLGPPSEPARLEPGHTGKEDAVTKPQRRSARKPQTIKPLTAVLAEADQAVPLPELFASAGYDRDSADDIERFYLALRDELSRTIEPVGDARENAPVELRRNAS
jgi:type I restriction enzyme S subunit